MRRQGEGAGRREEEGEGEGEEEGEGQEKNNDKEKEKEKDQEKDKKKMNKKKNHKDKKNKFEDKDKKDKKDMKDEKGRKGKKNSPYSPGPERSPVLILERRTEVPGTCSWSDHNPIRLNLAQCVLILEWLTFFALADDVPGCTAARIVETGRSGSVGGVSAHETRHAGERNSRTSSETTAHCMCTHRLVG